MLKLSASTIVFLWLFYSLTVVAHTKQSQPLLLNSNTLFYRTLHVNSSQKIMHYYASQRPYYSVSKGINPTTALIVIHGYPHDAIRTFNAASFAAEQAGYGKKVLVVAPIFQVDNSQAEKCHTCGMPEVVNNELQWSCSSWIQGEFAVNDNISSFDALDALIRELKRRWPSLHHITIAGFSAGAQMVQHYIGFSSLHSNSDLSIRYVVADPGTWLYFDTYAERYPLIASMLDISLKGITYTCPTVNQWKYGMENLPKHLIKKALYARKYYSEATIDYLEGELDNTYSQGAYYSILDKSCAANAQGISRVQRGLIYTVYDNAMLGTKQRHLMTTVAHCAHNVFCVFTSKQGQMILFKH